MNERGAYRRSQVRALFGATYGQIDAAISSGEIRTKRRGRAVFLNPEDVETLFGFRETVEPSYESVADLADFLS